VPPLPAIVEFRVVAFRAWLKCGNGAPAAKAGLLPPRPNTKRRPPIVISDQEQADTRLEFARLKQEHADFDTAINAMIATACDPLAIQRMKKKKLFLKDRLTQLEDRIVPDIIA
jgi:hypothetical protein